MENTRQTNETEWRHRPLCSKYLLLDFATLPVQVLQSGGLFDRTLLLAIGVLDDRQYEVVGARPLPSSSGLGWQEIVEDMSNRGVEIIRYVAGKESAALAAWLRAAHLDADLPVVLTRDLLSALPLRHRRAVRGSEAIVERLCRHSTLSIRRHGPFSDIANAYTFVNDVLEHAERRLDVSGPSAVLSSRGVQTFSGRRTTGGVSARTGL